MQELYKPYTIHEKKYGDQTGIDDVIVSKRKFQYEEVGK
jgi:crooked neck